MNMSLSNARAWPLWKKSVESRLFEPKSDLLAGLFNFTHRSPTTEDHLNVPPSEPLFSDPTQFPSEPQSRAAYRSAGRPGGTGPQHDSHTSSRRSAGGSLTSVSAGLDTKEATCSLGLKSGHCQTRWFLPFFQTVSVALVESQITPSCWASAHNGPFFLALEHKKQKDPRQEQCECTPPITVH